MKLFRKIRQELAAQNNAAKYMRYAFGEIVLVVIGILIALQVNNWNENRKQKIRFTGLLEQIYNSIYLDTQWGKANLESLNYQLNYIDTLVNNPSYINPKKLIHILYYVGLDPEKIKSNTSSLMQYLDYNSDDKNQRELTKQLLAYGGNMFDPDKDNRFLKIKTVTSILQDEDIPLPFEVFGLTSFRNFSETDSNFFSAIEIKKAQKIIPTKQFIAALKSLKSKKIFLQLDLSNSLDEGLSYLKLIKAYNPAIKLVFTDIGIVGTALETGWDRSIPMMQNDSIENVWELNIHLNNGYIKFRNRDSWAYNWGGKGFPNGNTIFYGEDITVSEGNYHIILDLNKNTYQFIQH
jgi:hypothetical protein